MPAGTLFLVDGPSGAGKSHLLRYAERAHGVTALPKYTTRPPGDDPPGAWSDLVHVSAAAFDRTVEFRYEMDGHAYGFSRTEIERALSGGIACLLVVRDERMIRRVREELRGAHVVAVWIAASAETRRRRLGREPAGCDAPRDEDLYDRVLPNDASIPEFHDRIDDMLRRCIAGRGDAE